MNESLFSPHWHRVASLKPRLRAQVRVLRQASRDRHWTLLSDPAGGRQLRLNESAYAIAGRCDGSFTVQQIWEAMVAADGEAAPTQDEVIAVLTRLDEADLLAIDLPLVDPEALFERDREQRARRRRAAVNPLAFRVPLGNPTRWLARLDPLGRWLLRAPVLALWLAAVALAALVAASEAGAIAAHASALFGTPRFLVLALVVFVAMKFVHETAHALALRRFGAEVPQVGISLLLLVPAPYVDASAAAELRSRGQRILVAAIGVMVELGLAAAALAAWTQVQPGAVRDAALVTMLVGTVSTLMFNGNPLLRFDAYYALADALDLPNLATRSGEYWRTLAQRWLLRVDVPPLDTARGERKWLLVYAPASFVWRLLILAAVIRWVGAQSTLLAAVLATYVALAVLLVPGAKFVHATLIRLPPGRELRRARLAGLGAAALAVAAVVALPLPSYTVAPGVVWPPDQAQIRPGADGFVRELPVADGARVEAGTLLAVLDNPELHAARARAQARHQSAQHELHAALLADPLRAQNLAAQAGDIEAEIARLDEQIASLELRAHTSGKLVMPRQADRLGRWAARGEPLGHIIDERAAATVRVAVGQDDVERVRASAGPLAVRIAGQGSVLAAAPLRDVPAATSELPSAALGEGAGGTLPVDPADQSGRRLLEPVFLLEMTLPARPGERIGQRAWVRFEHGAEPLAAQWWRRGSQLLLKHFNPSA
jgi:putative peptide zinc metalloprotease protein